MQAKSAVCVTDKPGLGKAGPVLCNRMAREAAAVAAPEAGQPWPSTFTIVYKKDLTPLHL